MDKVINSIDIAAGEIKIIDRKKINLTGIKKLVSFNPEEFLMETTLGVLALKGSSLEIIKLDTVEGILAIKGMVNSLNYIENNIKNRDNSLLAKLFR